MEASSLGCHPGDPKSSSECTLLLDISRQGGFGVPSEALPGERCTHGPGRGAGPIFTCPMG